MTVMMSLVARVAIMLAGVTATRVMMLLLLMWMPMATLVTMAMMKCWCSRWC